MHELKVCPFCGGKPEAILNMPFFRIVCKRCGAMGPRSMVEETAYHAWNTRVERTTTVSGSDVMFGSDMPCAYCDTCGGEVPVDSVYCQQCGAKVVE